MSPNPSASKARTPAIEGWMRVDPDDPRLLGTRCRSCGNYFFPRETSFCRKRTLDRSAGYITRSNQSTQANTFCNS